MQGILFWFWAKMRVQAEMAAPGALKVHHPLWASPQVQEGQTRNKACWRLVLNPTVKMIILRKIMIITPLFYAWQSDRYFSHVILSPISKALFPYFTEWESEAQKGGPLRLVSNKSQDLNAICQMPNPVRGPWWPCCPSPRSWQRNQHARRDWSLDFKT